jgi:hypothetical protein
MFSSAVLARLGETQEECKERYGWPNAGIPQKVGTKGVRLDYEKDDLKISIFFLDGKAAHISFRKDIEKYRLNREGMQVFRQGLIETLLTANSAGGQWRLTYQDPTNERLAVYGTPSGGAFAVWVGPADVDREWTLDNGRVFARYDYTTRNETSSSLEIFTQSFTDYMASHQNTKKQARDLNGF